MLSQTDLYAAVQPLSWRWLPDADIPPPDLLQEQDVDFVRGLRVYCEQFSLHTTAPLYFYNLGAYNMSNVYRDAYGLRPAANLWPTSFALAAFLTGGRQQLVTWSGVSATVQSLPSTPLR